TPSKHVLRHRRFRQWLPCEDDWLDGGLQSGAPAFPLAGRLGSRSSYGNGTSMRRMPLTIPLTMVALAVIPASLPKVPRDNPRPNNTTFSPELLVNRLPHVKGLGEAGAIKPHQTVADLKTGIFDGAGQTMIGAGAAEGQEVAARLED